MSNLILVWFWVAVMCGVLFFAYFLTVVGEVWQRINEYEAMRARGFTLMKDDKGDDFWVGYGD